MYVLYGYVQRFRFSSQNKVKANDYANFKACANRELFHGRKHRLFFVFVDLPGSEAPSPGGEEASVPKQNAAGR